MVRKVALSIVAPLGILLRVFQLSLAPSIAAALKEAFVRIHSKPMRIVQRVLTVQESIWTKEYLVSWERIAF